MAGKASGVVASNDSEPSTTNSRGAAAGEDESFTPKNRLKFLCSYGGKILPRPTDGRLKYVGGENRVLVVHRTISFAELKKNIKKTFRADLVIKYQLAKAEELDVLVSVTCDEDLVYMLDEYDRLDALHPSSPSSSSSPRFRLYLFSATLAAASTQSDGTAFDHCCCNEMAVSPEYKTSKLSGYTVSSAVTSPNATVDGPAGLPRHRTAGLGAVAVTSGGDRGMHRVHSTPNLGGCGGAMASPAAIRNGIKASDMIKHQYHHQHQHQHQHQYHHQHQYQHHIHGQHLPSVAYGPQVSGCGSGCGPWRMPGPTVRHEMCGCGYGCRVMAAPPHPVHGGNYYVPMTPRGHGGCECFGGNMEEPYAANLLRSSRLGSPPMTISRPSSPSMTISRPSSPLGARGPRKPVMWE